MIAQIIIGAFVGLVIGLVILLVMQIPGKSGDSLADRFFDWCENHLPW